MKAEVYLGKDYPTIALRLELAEYIEDRYRGYIFLGTKPFIRSGGYLAVYPDEKRVRWGIPKEPTKDSKAFKKGYVVIPKPIMDTYQEEVEL